MANRVLLGNDGSNYVLKVSKKAQNVLTASSSNLLFDSTKARTGQIYAGGFDLNLGDSADNFLTTGSKSNLGYIPAVIFTEKNNGERENDDFISNFVSEVSLWKTTTTTVTPITADAFTFTEQDPVGTLSAPLPNDNRNYSGVSSAREDATNVNYFVLRIPCAYGYMTSTNFS